MPQVQRGKPSDTIDFVRTMLGELRTMAEVEKCDMLVYLIEMAYVEASDVLHSRRPLAVRKKE